MRDSYILQLRPLWVQLARILPNLPTGKKRSTSLVSQVSESKISFKDAQLDAHAVVKDGCSVPCTSKLARLGGWGQHPGNCARDFRNAVLKKSVQMLPMYVVELPFLSADDNAVQWSEQAVVLPHEYLHYLSLHEKDFERRLFGEKSGREYCREYWQKAPASAWFGSHPARAKICADPCTVAPARLYGDDASYQKQRSALVLTWSSVLCRLPSMLSRFVITVLPLRNAVPETTQALYKIVAWSFAQMLEGKFPTADHTGTPWPEGSWRAQVAGAWGGVVLRLLRPRVGSGFPLFLSTRAHTHTTQTRTRILTHAHQRTPTHTHAHTRTRAHTRTHMHTHTHTFAHAHVPTHPPTHPDPARTHRHSACERRDRGAGTGIQQTC